MKSFLLPILLAVCLLQPFPAGAQQTPVTDSLAARFFTINYPDKKITSAELSTDTVFTRQNLVFYNYSFPKGFVILRDLEGKYDITGYSFDSNFSFDVDTTGFLVNLAESMATDTKVAGYAAARLPDNLKTGRWAIEPLVKTAWNQGWPYNILCPSDADIVAEDNHVVVGCVAVAMAQVIRYYDKWNDFGIYYSYTHPVYGTLTCNAGHYEWSKMENACYSVNNEVARLLYDCGVLVDMNYDRSGSGASSDNAAQRLNQIYGHGYLNNTPLEAEEEFWYNVSHYQPMYATYPGHAFVCDGYDGAGMYHFNLGWGGSANGFYSLDNVLSHNLTSAIFNAAPDLPEKPPRHILSPGRNGSQIEISWYRPDTDLSNLTGYKIYLDDQYLADAADTVFIHNCVPGDHYLKVSAQYSTGESRWIGPISYYFDGSPVTIPDATLKRALNSAIGISSSQVNSHVPTQGELLKVLRLTVNNALDFSGLDSCHNLVQITLYSTSTTRTLDLSPVGQCSRLANLSIQNYRLDNPDALANLKRLDALKLVNTQLGSTGFLNALTLVNRLEIDNDNITDIGFLNTMQRLEWLTLKNCGISDLSSVENTYGLRSVDISGNQVQSLAWLDGNRTLQSINASNNQLTGNLELSDMLVLRNIDLSHNDLEGFILNGINEMESVNLSYNRISDLTPVISANPAIQTLNVSHNQIGALPAISNQISDLQIQFNQVRELTMISRYSYLSRLNLSDNRIVDLTGLTTAGYHTRLSSLNLMNNPISKESYENNISIIRESGITAFLPSQYFPGSPCYLSPGSDISLTNNSMQFAWEGDYNDEGYTFSVCLSRDDAPVDTLATGLADRTFDYELPGTGRYSWYVVAQKDSTVLQSRSQSFKLMKGFSLPFVENFELYTTTVPLCAQSPYWKTFGTNPADPLKDASVNNSKAFEGVQSVKVSGTADIWFPVSDYLTGTCSAEFQMMVDRSRKGFFQLVMNGGTTVSFYFYSGGNVQMYNADQGLKYLTYKNREWFQVRITFTAPDDYKIWFDSQVVAEGKSGSTTTPGISGIRFGTADSPDSYEAYPVVFYVDDFNILNGSLLSTDNIPLAETFPARIISNDGQILLREIDPSIRDIRVISADGRVLLERQLTGPVDGSLGLAITAENRMLILLLRDEEGKVYYRKMVR